MDNRQVTTVKNRFIQSLEALSRAFPHAAETPRIPAQNTIGDGIPATGLPAWAHCSPPCAIAIAYSGGLDSSALLYLANEYAVEQGIRLLAFHIHHGISAHADKWLLHCKKTCEQLSITFCSQLIDVSATDKTGIEEAARILRYAALGNLCRFNKVSLLLTAHHLDDQAETVLLQLLRGSGMAGLSGMENANFSENLLGDNNIVMARPLLAVARAELEDYVQYMEIAYVEDESNLDQRHTRNILRHKIMPSLAGYFPGFQERFARTAGHTQAAQKLLIELAAQDFANCLAGEAVQIGKLREFSAERIHNLLRYWFAQRKLRMPSTAWLTEMCKQTLEARHDAQLCVTHPECHIRRHREHLFITPKIAKLDEEDISELIQSFRWNGEHSMRFKNYDGVLHFDEAEQGVDAGWLRAQLLKIHFRKGGERLKPAWNRPTKNLKYHYQALNIPAWERERLPIVATKDSLLLAGGIGMDCRHFSADPGVHVHLRWQQDQT